MSIIRDWLSDFKPECNFVKSALNVKGARVFEEDRSPDYVYVGAYNMYDKTSSDKRTICIQNDDYMILDTTDMPAVFNSIMECFSYYHEWEDDCRALIYHKCPIGDIIETSSRIFREYLLLLDRNFFIMATAKGFSEDDVSNANAKQKLNIDFWEGIISTSVVPVSMIQRFSTNRNPLHARKKTTASISLGTGIVPVTMSGAAFESGMYCYVILSNIYSSPSETKEHLLTCLMKILDTWANYNFLDSTSEQHTGLMSKMFKSGEVKDTAALHQRLVHMGWHDNDRLQFMQIEHTKGNAVTLRQICYTLNGIPGCYCAYDDRYAYLLANLNIIKRNDFYNVINNSIKKASCRAGVSLLFSELGLIFTQQQFAETALRYGNKEDGSISFINDYILHAARKVIESGCLKEFYHPAVNQLERYDMQHETDLSVTFLNYLLCGMNCMKTGKKMFLHRNTVEYRVNKAIECIDVDFDNDQDFVYMLLSFLLKYESTYRKVEGEKFEKERLSILSSYQKKNAPTHSS